MKNEQIAEKSKGLYYNVNKRKKAGTSRKKGHPDAPTDQDWKNAAKTAKESTNEGLGELAQMAERDHEVQMARAELYKIAKYAIKLHEMLKGVTEAEGMEGWQQSKITKAADYIGSVYHALDYDMKFDETTNESKLSPATCGCNSGCGHCGGDHQMDEVGKECDCCGNKIYERKKTDEGKYKNAAQRKAVHAAKAEKKKNEDAYKSELAKRLQESVQEVLEAQNTCPECGKEKLTKTEMQEIADLEEGEKHGNSKIYDKCWKGCRKVAGKKRGEPGSCKCD